MSGRFRTFALVTMAVACWGWTSVGAQSRNNPWYSLGDPYRLTGTYRLDRAQSDNLRQIADRVTASMRGAERSRVQQQLLEQLEPPEEISIDRRGTTVTIASSTAPQFTFDADGRDRTENAAGRQMRTHADIYGDELTVTTTGARGRDFTVRFSPTQNGMRVTRQLDHTALETPITVHSVYRRTSDQPRWDVYRDDPYPADRATDRWSDARGGRGRGRSGGTWVLIPEGVRLVARLDERLRPGDLETGEPFSLTVTSGQYRNAIITGRAGARTQRGDQTDLLLDLTTVELNGQSGPFAGRVESIRTPDGRVIEVSRTGGIQDADRSGSNTVQRGAIGAAIGGLIGALGWGTRGAVIGAVAGGAGMILIGRGDEVSIPAGSEFVIVSSR